MPNPSDAPSRRNCVVLLAEVALFNVSHTEYLPRAPHRKKSSHTNQLQFLATSREAAL